MCSLQRNNENMSLVTQKETVKWSVYFKTMTRHYRNLVWQSNKKSEIIPLNDSKKTPNKIKVKKSAVVHTKWKNATAGPKKKGLGQKDTCTWNCQNDAQTKQFHIHRFCCNLINFYHTSSLKPTDTVKNSKVSVSGKILIKQIQGHLYLAPED